MKLFLFGGAELENNQVSKLKNLIKETLISQNPKKILHVPFARLSTVEEEWKEGWFKEIMANTGIRILDARVEDDLAQADGAGIFINGGHGKNDLLNAINSNQKLRNIILSSEFIVAESAGSAITGEYLRVSDDGKVIEKGLGILKKTIIEPHFTQRNRKELLLSEIKKSKMKYGLGIDSVTGIIVDPGEFPLKWNKVGEGNVFIYYAI